MNSTWYITSLALAGIIKHRLSPFSYGRVKLIRCSDRCLSRPLKFSIALNSQSQHLLLTFPGGVSGICRSPMIGYNIFGTSCGGGGVLALIQKTRGIPELYGPQSRLLGLPVDSWGRAGFPKGATYLCCISFEQPIGKVFILCLFRSYTTVDIHNGDLSTHFLYFASVPVLSSSA